MKKTPKTIKEILSPIQSGIDEVNKAMDMPDVSIKERIAVMKKLLALMVKADKEIECFYDAKPY